MFARDTSLHPKAPHTHIYFSFLTDKAKHSLCHPNSETTQLSIQHSKADTYTQAKPIHVGVVGSIFLLSSAAYSMIFIFTSQTFRALHFCIITISFCISASGLFMITSLNTYSFLVHQTTQQAAAIIIVKMLFFSLLSLSHNSKFISDTLFWYHIPSKALPLLTP